MLDLKPGLTVGWLFHGGVTCFDHSWPLIQPRLYPPYTQIKPKNMSNHSKSAGQAIFRHIKSRLSPGFLQGWMRSLDSGTYTLPQSFNILSK
jgi:hypothetical protein